MLKEKLVTWIFCKLVILFCCTKETVIEGITCRGVPLACLADIQRGWGGGGRSDWEERLLTSLQNRHYIFAFLRRERASTGQAWPGCETGMTEIGREKTAVPSRAFHLLLEKCKDITFCRLPSINLLHEMVQRDLLIAYGRLVPGTGLTHLNDGKSALYKQRT